MKKPSFLNCRNSQLASLFALLAMTINAHADSATWNGADGVWATVGNWNGPPALAPGAADTATFSSTGYVGTGLAPINNLGTVSVNSIVFDGTAQDYRLTGTINLTAGGSVVSNNGNQTIAGLYTETPAASGIFVPTLASINTAGSASFTNNGAGTLTLGINSVFAGSILTFDGTGAITTVAGGNGLAASANTTAVVKNGSGTLTLGNVSNTNVQGGFTVTAGTVVANNANALSNRGLTIGNATIQMTVGNAASFNFATSNISITGDTTLHYTAASGNWNIGNTAVTSLFGSTGAHTVTFTDTTANINGIRIVGNTSGFSGTYKLGQNGALTFNGAARGSSTSTLNMGDAATGSHYFSTGVSLQDAVTQTITPIKFGALTGTDSGAIMSGRQNLGTNTIGTQFEVGALNTNTAYAGSIRDGHTSNGNIAVNGLANGTNQVTPFASTYNRGAGAAGAAATTEFVKVGSATQTLTGTNSYTGGTVVKGGVLAINSDAALGAAYDGSLHVFSYIPGTGVYTALDLPDAVLTGGGGTGASVNVFSGAFGNNANNNLFLSFSNQPNDTTATAIVNNLTGSGYTSVPTVSFTGGTLGTAGTVPVASVRVQGLVTLDGGTLQTDAGINSNRAIVIGAGNGTISTQGFNSTFSGNINGSGNLSLTGGGTVTLSANNSLTGTATVGANTTLALAGALAGAVQVDSTGTIKGNGTVSGNLAVAAGGTVSPGNSPGNLTVGNGLTLAGNYTWELGALSTANPGTDFDTVTVTAGSVDISGAILQLSLGAFAPSGDSFWQTDQTWNAIINDTGAGSLNGFFAAIDNSAWSSLGAFSTNNVDNDVNLVWTAAAIPEPATGATLGLASMMMLLYRRRATRN
jgi:fibronectin-binding autotransporter adhesin